MIEVDREKVQYREEEAGHEKPGLKLGLKKVPPGITKEHQAPRPGGSQRPGIRLVAIPVNSHRPPSASASSFAFTTPWPSKRYPRARRPGNSPPGSGAGVPRQYPTCPDAPSQRPGPVS